MFGGEIPLSFSFPCPNMLPSPPLPAMRYSCLYFAPLLTILLLLLPHYGWLISACCQKLFFTPSSSSSSSSFTHITYTTTQLWDRSHGWIRSFLKKLWEEKKKSLKIIHSYCNYRYIKRDTPSFSIIYSPPSLLFLGSVITIMTWPNCPSWGEGRRWNGVSGDDNELSPSNRKQISRHRCYAKRNKKEVLMHTMHSQIKNIIINNTFLHRSMVGFSSIFTW